MKKAILSLMALLCCLSAQALEVPEIFSSYMVLQQQSKAHLWGWATKGSEVSITTSWEKTFHKAIADKKSGRWDIYLDTPPASYEQQAVTIVGDGSQIKLDNVLIGEVWFCSGQSNMEMPLRGFWNCPVEGALDAVATSGRYQKSVRVATVPKVAADKPQERVGGKWKECTPQNAAEFSALGFFFARTLTDLLNVPVGIINCSWGGSTVEGWLPREILETYPDGLVPFNDVDWMRKMVMYNGMLAPLAGYTVKGFLWNQGESNIGRHQMYQDRFTTMANHWRKLWNDDTLPIYTVELPPYWYDNAEGTNGPDFRAVQHQIAKDLPHSGCVCTTDLCYPYETKQIHGTKKLEIGQRMAYLAAARDYGMYWIHAEAPEFDHAKVVEAKPGDVRVIAGSAVAANPDAKGQIVELYFTEAREGFDRLSDIQGFEAQDANGQWHNAIVWADSNNTGCLLKLACPEAGEVKAIRYNYHNFQTTTCIHNMWGLPVVPFITNL